MDVPKVDLICPCLASLEVNLLITIAAGKFCGQIVSNLPENYANTYCLAGMTALVMRAAGGVIAFLEHAYNERLTEGQLDAALEMLRHTAYTTRVTRTLP